MKVRLALVLAATIFFHAMITWTGWFYVAFVCLLSAVTAFLYKPKSLSNIAGATSRSTAYAVASNVLVYLFLNTFAASRWNSRFEMADAQRISHLSVLNSLPELLLVTTACAVIAGFFGATVSALITETQLKEEKKQGQ